MAIEHFIWQPFGKDLDKRFPQETGKTPKINPDILPSSSGIYTGISKMSYFTIRLKEITVLRT